MKRYYVVLALIFSLAFVFGLCSRQSSIVSALQATPTQQRIPKVVEAPAQTDTPELVAVPLGTFTPRDTVQVYGLPNHVSEQSGELAAQKPVAYTSEYRTQGELWVCVMWEVGQAEKSWRCTGWTMVEQDGERYGDIERSWSPPERKQEQERSA